VRQPFSDSPEFRRLLAGDGAADLLRVALEIARDAYPNLDIESYLARMEELAHRVRGRCAAIDRPRAVLGQINRALYEEEGFHPNVDDYYDSRNSYLNDVLDRKTGIPITLSLIYWRIAVRLGLEVAGLNLPAHFMLRVGQGEAMVFVDAFHRGAIHDRPGCEGQMSRLLGREFRLTEELMTPCTPDVVVARMLRNLKAIHLRNEDFPAALPVQRRLAALSAQDPREQRDLGMIFLHLSRPADAIEPLQSFVDSAPDDADAEAVRALLRSARRDVSSWN
jgi:regulator of sirC expression with transglutaminase-like and TPR domain